MTADNLHCNTFIQDAVISYLKHTVANFNVVNQICFVDRIIDSHLRTIPPDTSAVEFVVPDSEERMNMNYISGDDSHTIAFTNSSLFFEVVHRLMSRREEGYSPGKGHLKVKADRERIIAYELTISHRRILLTCSSDENR